MSQKILFSCDIRSILNRICLSDSGVGCYLSNPDPKNDRQIDEIQKLWKHNRWNTFTSNASLAIPKIFLKKEK